jgi:hypothetical protein
MALALLIAVVVLAWLALWQFGGKVEIGRAPILQVEEPQYALAAGAVHLVVGRCRCRRLEPSSKLADGEGE